MNATMEFLCESCMERTKFTGSLALGENTIDITCMHCGERWHAHFCVLSFEPWQTMNFEIKRNIGVLQDGIFYAKEQLQ